MLRRRSPCQHRHTRCIHGDEILYATKTYLFRFWKKPIIHRQMCLDCNTPLDRPPICRLFVGHHEYRGIWV